MLLPRGPIEKERRRRRLLTLRMDIPVYLVSPALLVSNEHIISDSASASWFAGCSGSGSDASPSELSAAPVSASLSTESDVLSLSESACEFSGSVDLDPCRRCFFLTALFSFRSN